MLSCILIGFVLPKLGENQLRFRSPSFRTPCDGFFDPVSFPNPLDLRSFPSSFTTPSLQILRAAGLPGLAVRRRVSRNSLTLPVPAARAAWLPRCARARSAGMESKKSSGFGWSGRTPSLGPGVHPDEPADLAWRWSGRTAALPGCRSFPPARSRRAWRAAPGLVRCWLRRRSGRGPARCRRRPRRPARRANASISSRAEYARRPPRTGRGGPRSDRCAFAGGRARAGAFGSVAAVGRDLAFGCHLRLPFFCSASAVPACAAVCGRRRSFRIWSDFWRSCWPNRCRGIHDQP